ncbi:MAG: pectinesterase family protein [Bacteroidales bacterium]|jgi:pectin methylesterase-like acyl-CoA thioesterase|nr:pectinesterase family protein [Bacteroidales bacterium]
MKNTRKNHLFIIIAFLLFGISSIRAQQLAFPTADGFGKYTTGGRGGKLYIVTNLNNSGSGSLREAVEASGNRVVVFAVSGVIQLQSQLKFTNDNLTIFGQTAPGDGICIANYTFQVAGNNLIVRYMRFRPGSYQIGEYDASWGRNNSDIIFDHCSFSWGNDEQASFYDNENFTMQYCIISESFYASTHPKGNHGYGGIWGGMGASFHHNLIANHTSRTPRFCGARYHLTTASTELVDFRNNVIFNWGFNSAYGGEAGNHNMVNNYYKPGPATSTGDRQYRIVNPSDVKADGNPISKWYINGNYMAGNTTVTSDNWNGGVQQDDGSISQSELRLYSPLSAPINATESATDAYNTVLNNAGASLQRDAVDIRAVNAATTGVTNYGGVYGANLGIVDNENQVGGFPTYNTYNIITDTDNDGMADSWELLNGLNVGAKDDAGDIDGDGYTNIEEYANSLLTPASTNDNMVPVDNAVNVSNDMQFKLSFNSAPVLQSSGKIRLYQSNGTLVETIDLSQMPSGVPTSATWPWIETLNATAIRVIPVTVDGKSVYIRFSDGAMAYSTGYYITVDQSIFSNASAIGFTGITANNWSFTTRSQPAADLNYTVSADGTGDFATLQGALNFLPSGASNAKIVIKNGTYVGLAFMKNKSGYTIEGESREGVIIKGFNNSNLNASTHWRSVINLQGDDINLISLTFINTTPNGGTQAEVLKLNGNRCVVVNCDFYSYQDTVLIEGKVYFKDCMLEGDVDFIWGVGTVFFQSCELRANDNGGYNVMARNDNTKHGYAFADCNLTRTSTATATQYLGRDANISYPYAEIVYLNCTMGSQIPAVGWNIRTEMTGTEIFFGEYQSVDESGNLKNISSRHSLSKQLTAAENTLYRNLDWFFNGWTPVVPAYSSGNKPVVTITSPVNNASFETGTNITITASAIASDGTISKVEFYNGSTKLGEATAAPYSFTWNNVLVGSYTITAVATDNDDLQTTSESVSLKVNVLQGPYGGNAHPIPGLIEFEEYDEGGNGFAYFDDSPGSETAVAYRTNEDVDIEDCTDTGAGYSIGYSTIGEWLEYTVNVASAGIYKIDVRVACSGDDRTISLEMQGGAIATDVAIPNTTGWQVWQTVTLNNITLNAGVQVMRVIIGNVDYVNLNNITFTAVLLKESPIVSITNPIQDQTFNELDNIVLEANASDADGTVTKVTYYNGTNKLGESTTAPYTFNWNSVSAGDYNIIAVAIDNEGFETASDTIRINVLRADCAGVFGGTAFYDDCLECVGGTTGLSACVPDKIQAEYICQFDGTVDSNNLGFEGVGFVNTPNAIGSKVTHYIYSAIGDNITFKIQYANGGTTDRSVQILLNDVEVNTNLSLPPTGAWTTYTSIETTIQLEVGVNKIELIANTGDGMPSIDFFEMYGKAEFTGCPTQQTIELMQGWNLISTNLYATDNSISTVFNGLDVALIKDANGFWKSGQVDAFNSLTTIETGKAYLVYMNNAGTLNISGVPIPISNFQFLNGWNLIGCPYQVITPFSTDFNTSNCELIKNFDGFWEPNGSLNGIENMEPGKGYFINSINN